MSIFVYLKYYYPILYLYSASYSHSNNATKISPMRAILNAVVIEIC